MHDQVVDGITQFTRSLKVGPALQPGTQVGMLGSDERLTRRMGYVETGLAGWLGCSKQSGCGRKNGHGSLTEVKIVAISL